MGSEGRIEGSKLRNQHLEHKSLEEVENSSHNIIVFR
jgi:hypothetical protein